MAEHFLHGASVQSIENQLDGFAPHEFDDGAVEAIGVIEHHARAHAALTKAAP